MGGFNPPVPQQDNNWEIRVAVLLSLFFQVVILFLGPMRKRSSSPVARFIIWSCYLLSDWVADLALGLLLNNIGNIGGNGDSSSSSRTGLRHVTAADNTGASPIIFAFWTPFLLLHLGGQDTVTSFSIQDNDLWRRHLIGLLFELCSACVIFFCSLQGNPMIPATVLMFVAGVIKYGERTYSLYSGSVDGALADIFGDPDPGPNYGKLMGLFNGKEQAGLPVEIVIAEDEAKALDEQAEITRLKQNTTSKSLEAKAYHLLLVIRRLCFDVKLSYEERRISRAFFPEHSPTMAFQVVELELNFIYDMLHTKAPVAHSKAGCVLRFIGSTCVVSTLLIFFFHHKGGFTRIDVAITYALLLGGMALDVATFAMLLVSNWTLVFLEETTRLAWLAKAIKSVRPRQKLWKEDTLQLNLVSYCLYKPDPYGGGSRCLFGSPRVVRELTKVADALCIREVFDDFFFIRRESLCIGRGRGELLLQFMFDELKDKASRAKTMKYKEITELCSYRGVGVLGHHRESILKALNERLTSQVAGDGGKHPVILDEEEEKKQQQEVLKERSTSQVAGDGGEHPVILDEEEEKKQQQEVLKERSTSQVAGDGGEHPVILDEQEEEKKQYEVLVESVYKDFDESLLLWHIATDLCFYQPAKKPENKYSNIGKTLSEYMLYLLIKQPDILMASAGIGLKRYRDTCAEAQRFIQSSAWDPDDDEARKMLLGVNTSKKPSEVKGDRSKSVLFDAVILAKVLRELDWELMCEVVAGVWGEMLTYAAVKCRGSTHVRQLSRGGELITMVWCLMAHMGLILDDYKAEQEKEHIAKLIVHDK